MRYTVKGTDIQHNGILYPENSEIELTDKEAKQIEKYLEVLADSGSEQTPAADTKSKGGKSK